MLYDQAGSVNVSCKKEAEANRITENNNTYHLSFQIDTTYLPTSRDTLVYASKESASTIGDGSPLEAIPERFNGKRMNVMECVEFDSRAVLPHVGQVIWAA